jgi:hypothetical protein
MPKNQLGRLLLENRRIIFRNFSGAEGRFNAEGDRNFHVLLEEQEAEEMLKDGWNVKYLQSREEGEPQQAHLIVTVKYGRTMPPRIILITSRGKTPLDESMIQLLDWAEFDNVDMILNPYEWGPINGKSGVKAYLYALYATIHEDELELKYAAIPDSAMNSLPVSDEPEMIHASSEIISIERGSTPF